MELNFIIEKGNHYSNKYDLPIPRKIKDSEYGEYLCTICMVALPTAPQGFYSKLIGVAHILGSRYRSERIGWLYTGNKHFEFAFFSETKQDFKISGARLIKAVQVNSFWEVKIVVGIFKDKVTLGGSTKAFTEKNLCFWGHPYFGGTPVADQNYYIDFTKI
jgi:hypothetical protein